MISEILAYAGTNREALKSMGKNRYYRRVMIIDYWQQKGYISIQQEYALQLKEIQAKYQRLTNGLSR